MADQTKRYNTESGADVEASALYEIYECNVTGAATSTPVVSRGVVDCIDDYEVDMSADFDN